MKNRQRMTWAALDRKASAAPAIPGYGVEDQDHPAHTQDDPDQDDYNIGGPSEFGEDVFPPPYGDSGPPATPGYGVEDQEHPAHAGQVGRKANLMGLVRKKASKALKLAQATLGKKANWAAIEDQAFNYMSMDEDALDASLDRLSGGFLADDESDDLMADENDMMADEMPMEESPIMARMKAMEEELTALKRQAFRRADQNEAPSGTDEAGAKAEEKAVSDKSARTKLARLFAACDDDNDGFVMQEDWVGPADVFAALDTDKDGIIAKHEVLGGEVPEAFKKQWEKNDKDDDKESGKKAKKADDDEPEESDDDESEESDDESEESDDDAKESGKKAKKADDGDDDEDDKNAKKAFGHLADFDDEELDMLQAMQYGADDLDDVGETACGDVMASKKADDEGDESDDEGDESDDEGEGDSDKEASFFATGFDPMGLSDGTSLTAADKAAFEEVFGKQGSDDDDDADGADDADDEKAEKAANKRLASLLKPQPRKLSKGVKSVGAVSKTASGRNEVAELSNLWASDPDVSDSFS